jgi:hypothetical protein
MLRNHISKIYLKQVTIHTTLLNYRTLQINHRKIFIKQTVDKFSLNG